MRNRQETEKLEEDSLAPYASKSKNSRGRINREDEHPYRTVYMRDRDRVVHSSAFRRLEYKTQVFVYHEGDYYRTRLTHTLEVSQISRSNARALRLNEDLSEAIALSHDLGHPPFGHSGERALNELMEGHGGFEHNLHSLRIVEHVEHKYPNFRGLNLTWEAREAIAKHSKSLTDPAVEEFHGFPNPSLEAQIVDLTDSVTYFGHDLDDGLTSGLISEGQLDEIAMWRKALKFVQLTGKMVPNITRYQVIRRIIDAQVGDMIRQTENNIKRFSVEIPDHIRAQNGYLADFSADMRRERTELKEFLRHCMYRHHRVIRMEEKAYNVVIKLFEAYDRTPELLPANVQKQLENVDKKRLICDYIAGMTDRFALEEHEKLFDPMSRV